MPCCVLLEGEYGQNDICLGVPVIIGKNGWEEIVDYKLNEEEQAAFSKSAATAADLSRRYFTHRQVVGQLSAKW